MALVQKTVDQWFEALDRITRSNYESSIRYIIERKKQSDRRKQNLEDAKQSRQAIYGFVQTAVKDPDSATSFLLDWIEDMKKDGKLSSQSIRSYLAAVKSLLLWSNAKINTYQLRKALPKLNRPKNRAPKTEEIRSIFEISDIRGKFLISLLSSSGIRVGAIDYFSRKDLVEREDGLGELTVYRGEPEEYIALISSECVSYWKLYFEERRRSGEEIRDNSPLLRFIFDARGRRRDYSTTKGEITRATKISVQDWFQDKWKEAGITTREFKQVHGFRAFFKTRLGETDMKDEDVERLMGHKGKGVIFAYNKKDMDHLASQYLKYQDALFIAESREVSKKLEQSQKEKGFLENELYIKNKRLEDELTIMKAQREKDTQNFEALDKKFEELKSFLLNQKS